MDEGASFVFLACIAQSSSPLCEQKREEFKSDSSQVILIPSGISPPSKLGFRVNSSTFHRKDGALVGFIMLGLKLQSSWLVIVWWEGFEIAKIRYRHHHRVIKRAVRFAGLPVGAASSRAESFLFLSVPSLILYISLSVHRPYVLPIWDPSAHSPKHIFADTWGNIH